MFEKEVSLIKEHLLESGQFLEIGVGTGRFAEVLGTQLGVDPSENMLKLAAARGVQVQLGVAEDLLYKDSYFDQLFFITSFCFLNDIEKSIEEARRVLKSKGLVTIAFIDKDSRLGRKNKSKKKLFYAEAKFHSASEIENLFTKLNFRKKYSGINFNTQGQFPPYDFCALTFQKQD